MLYLRHMFGLGKHGPDGRYGVVVDIGSGSVGLAIVASDPLEKSPEIIWTHRERMILKKDSAATDSSKNITTTLVNCMLILGSEGIQSLKQHDSHAKVATMQVAISAPWSYTITKSVSYHKDEPFEITKRLVTELIETAQKQAIDLIDEDDLIKKLGLELITRATIHVSANDYNVGNVYGQTAEKLSVTHVSGISQKKLLDAIKESKEKVLPSVILERYTFMLIFYCVLQKMRPDTTEVCLIDITSEATEIGIVRDGVLRYTTHTPSGIYTLARDIAALCDIPHEEALGFIRGNTTFVETLSEAKKSELQVVIDTFIEEIATLFKRTGDQLAIPRPLFIHTDDRCETFFSDIVKQAAHKATKAEHGIHLITSKLLPDHQLNDTAILLSAHFFHNPENCATFEQL